MDLLQELIDREIVPIVLHGKVIQLKKGEDNKLLTAEEYEELGLDKDNLGFLEPHPEGSDRGGYLPQVGAYQYDENGDGWQ